jgi:hypothetical protein
MYLQKVISKITYIFFVVILKVTDEQSRVRSQIRKPEVLYGSEDQDPYQMSRIRNTGKNKGDKKKNILNRLGIQTEEALKTKV